MSKVLVAVVNRTDLPLAPEDVCTTCKHYVLLDNEAKALAVLGGQPLCVLCARELELRHPGTFSDDTLAKLALAEDTDYPRSVVGY